MHVFHDFSVVLHVLFSQDNPVNLSEFEIWVYDC